MCFGEPGDGSLKTAGSNSVAHSDAVHPPACTRTAEPSTSGELLFFRVKHPHLMPSLKDVFAWVLPRRVESQTQELQQAALRIMPIPGDERSSQGNIRSYAGRNCRHSTIDIRKLRFCPVSVDNIALMEQILEGLQQRQSGEK